MTNILASAKFGGGAGLLSPAATDNIQDISTADLTLAASDMGKLLRVRNTRPLAKITLPAATGLTASNQVKSVGIAVSDNGPPIGVFNAGTAGTDPTLEKVLKPGTAGALTAYSTASAAGTWGAHGSITLPGYPWPTGSAPVTKTLGATALGNQGGRTPLIFLTSTLAAVTYCDSTNNVQLVALSLNTDGTINAVSNATQLRSGAVNALQDPSLCKLNSSGKVMARWWDNTNTKSEFVAVTITAGNPPTIGTPGSVIDDTSITANDRMSVAGSAFIQDGTDAVWFAGAMNVTTGSIAYHLTVATTTITLNTSNKWNTNAATPAWNGYLVSTGNLMVAAPSGVANAAELQLLNYAASTISVTWTARLPGVKSTTGGVLIDVDSTNGVFALATNDGAENIVMFKINTGTGAVSWVAVWRGIQPNQTATALSWRNPYFLLGDGELMTTALVSSEKYEALFYLDIKAAMATSGPDSATAGIARPQDVIGQTYPLIGTDTSTNNMGPYYAFDTTARTLLCCSVPTPLSGNWLLSFQSFKIPRR